MLRRLFFRLFILKLCLFSYVNLTAQQAEKHIVIRKITVTGNIKTRENIILRELPFKTGDSIKNLEENFRLAHQQLMNTELFLEVNFYETFTDSGTNILVEVRERWYIIPEPLFQLAGRDFNRWWGHNLFTRVMAGVEVTHQNFRGRNEKLAVGAYLGWQQGFNISYKLPFINNAKTLGMQMVVLHMRGKRLGYTVEDNLLQLIHTNNNLLYQSSKAEYSIIYRKKLKVSNILGISYENHSIADTLANFLYPQYLGNKQNNISVPGFFYRFMYDNRNFYFYPTKGQYLTFDFINKFVHNQQATPLLRGNYRQYFSFGSKVSAAAGILGQHLLSTKQAPFIFQPFLNYRYTVRGYERYYIFGKSSMLAKSELRFKYFDKEYYIKQIPVKQFNTIPIKAHIKIFSDIGKVWKFAGNENSLAGANLWSWGIGTDIVTYYDKIFRLEYSFPRHGKNNLFLHFTNIF